MAIIVVNEKEVAISITEEQYQNHNKEYIDETIGYFIEEKAISGVFECQKEDDIENKLTINWEVLKSKDELLATIDDMINEISTRANHTLKTDFKKASNISRIIDRLELVKTEITDRM